MLYIIAPCQVLCAGQVTLGVYPVVVQGKLLNVYNSGRSPDSCLVQDVRGVCMLFISA